MNKSLTQVNRGYSRIDLEKLLGVSRGKIRYWREKFDPLPQRSHFSGPVLLVYRAITCLVIDMNISVKNINNFHEVFKQCVETPFNELSNKEIIYDFKTREVKFQDINIKSKNKNRHLSVCSARIDLGALFQEHILSLACFGIEEQSDSYLMEDVMTMNFLKLVSSNS